MSYLIKSSFGPEDIERASVSNEATGTGTPGSPQMAPAKAGTKKHLGLLLACEHYPHVRSQPGKIDGQLRTWLKACGHSVGSVSVFRTYQGELPEVTNACDLWIVSGALLEPYQPSADHYGMLKQFLRGAVASHAPVFGLYHAEHILHAALAARIAQPPNSRAFPWSIRNPFESFRQKDRLFEFDRALHCVSELTRPTELTVSGMFHSDRCAA